MKDVNGSSFHLLAEPADWSLRQNVVGDKVAHLAGRQKWLLPKTFSPADAKAALAKTTPLTIDSFSGQARIAPDGMSVQTLDGATWTGLTDRDGAPLAPGIGKFVAMSLAGARLALLASDGAHALLQVFDLRGRWGLASLQNPPAALTPDPQGTALAAAPDGAIFVLAAEGLAIYEGGPAEEFFAPPTTEFTPVTVNPDPLRRTAALTGRPGGAALAMTADEARVVILLDQGAGAQSLAALDRASGVWTQAPLAAADATPLPYMTDVALLPEGRIALMAPAVDPSKPLDCAVGALAPGQGIDLAPFRYPMLDQAAPRFAAIGGTAAHYLGLAGPRALTPLPYPAYAPAGALARFAVAAGDPDQVWHRLYAEADLPPGTSLAFWARASEQPLAQSDGAAAAALTQAAPEGLTRLDSQVADALAGAGAPIADSLRKALDLAPFHRQPPLVPCDLPSELPFHPGLAALAGGAGGLNELLLQRSCGANRRLTGAFLDLVVLLSGDGRRSPLLRAIRLYSPRFSYQDRYLPALFHQTSLPDETDEVTTPAPADFRERLFANLEGLLTPLENRAATAEYLLDPRAAPAAALPWLASYLGLTIDPGWPEARRRRAIALAGKRLRWRGAYRGVCLALDIATDGAVARGEIVVLETARLRRADPTVLGVPMGDRNPLTGGGAPSGNSIIGDTLILSPERLTDLATLLNPAVGRTASLTEVALFLSQYADRHQVAAILQGPTAAAWRPAVDATLQAELPAHLSYDIVLADGRFILGLSPLLGIDTFLDPPAPPAALTLNQSVVGRDSVVRNPAALRQ